jgi:SWI/SNF-related matrix-associated actin-dependent regulator 1 of chromatin subfamily A
MRLVKERGAFVLRGDLLAGGLDPSNAGFRYTPELNAWATFDPYVALRWIDIADNDVLQELIGLEEMIGMSHRSIAYGDPVPAPTGCEYMPFQVAGIHYARMFRHSMIADEPGLGKTIQAIGIANAEGIERFVVVCPAHLRYNWLREIERWHGMPAVARMSGKEPWPDDRTVVTSYELLPDNLPAQRFVVCDEAHYLKSPGSVRTRKVLGYKDQYRGLAYCAERSVMLTGTPIPNWPHEIFPIIYRLAPHIIPRMSYDTFLKRYCRYKFDHYGRLKVFAALRTRELNARLRAGFMVRRLKKNVLQDLPDRSYKMIVFPPDASMQKVLEAESNFDADEIREMGSPDGDPENAKIRRLMGVAKAPMCATYVRELLMGGVNKVVLFAYHHEAIQILSERLAVFNPVVVTGKTSAANKQRAVDAFQTDTSVRVFIGNYIAAGVGYTLTASSDVVFAEASWTPGDNEQAIDRTHRIGQAKGVVAHFLVVEGSLDALILSVAANKQHFTRRILDADSTQF